MSKTTTTTSTSDGDPEFLHDLLNEGVFTIKETPLADARQVSLPGLFAALDQYPDLVLARMRPHQEFALLSFLVYLSAACGGTLHRDEAKYRHSLLALTHGIKEAWCLYVKDTDRPAFFQSPGIPRPWGKNVKQGPTIDHGTELYSPNDLDVFFTKDNFGPYKHADLGWDAESWTMALISQRMQAIPAASNGTSVRGDHGRVCVAFIDSIGFGSRYRRFVKIAIDEEPNLRTAGGFKGSEVALWVKPFVTGRETFKPKDLSPHFLDDPAKLRFFIKAGKFSVRRFTFEPMKVDGEVTKKGRPKTETKFDRVVGLSAGAWDIFSAVQIRKPGSKNFKRKLYTASIANRQASLFQSDTRGPFDYVANYNLLFSGDYHLPAAYTADLDQDSQSGYVLLQGIAVDSGKAFTFGFRERLIEVDRGRLAQWRGKEVGAFAGTHVRIAKRGHDILKEALVTLLKTRSRLDKRALKTPLVVAYLTEYHNAIDARFFDALLARVDGKPVEDWFAFVRTTMEEIFAKAQSLISYGRAAQSKALAREVLNQPLFEEPKPARKAKKEAA
jgi:hypothetical protein